MVVVSTLFPKEIMSCFNSETVAMYKHVIELVYILFLNHNIRMHLIQ
jgi:hypothetical protein